ncbi:MAG: CDGSH iron-sulfur domain-containing protein [Myxococcales bacterium]|nr:CDGSH iron-sulfur domain-containing protein [Myxococcales bacterium]
MTDGTTTYEGVKIRVVYDAKLCIHAAECGRSAGDLFQGGRDPWCDPDAVAVDEVTEIVARCPTGALTFERKDGGPGEAAPDHNVVTISPDGPIYVRGDVVLDGAEGQGVPTRMALCRCGASKNKPFCDNSHVELGFKDAGPVGERGKGLPAQGGKLEINRARNGPLLLSGNVTIRAGSGRDAWEGTKCALCRCGQSKNKPFCDGSHVAAGFQAD